ncbi:hypothetical protein EDD15DRAFT_1189184 [Pisolithus albus]|nr:hypothetical protein EDD15DRAFT_1189184 [Pisolithus albus]
MSKSQGHDFNPYYFTYDAFLPSMPHDGHLVHPAQFACQMPGLCTCAVFPAYNQGAQGPELLGETPHDNIIPADVTQTALELPPASNHPVTYVCPLGDECSFLLEATTGSLYAHLPLHGHDHKHRERAPCPWPGCSKTSRWGNVARHIIERHFAVKRQCKYPTKAYKRKGKSHAKGSIVIFHCTYAF